MLYCYSTLCYCIFLSFIIYSCVDMIYMIFNMVHFSSFLLLLLMLISIMELHIMWCCVSPTRFLKENKLACILRSAFPSIVFPPSQASLVPSFDRPFPPIFFPHHKLHSSVSSSYRICRAPSFHLPIDHLRTMSAPSGLLTLTPFHLSSKQPSFFWDDLYPGCYGVTATFNI